MGSEKPDEARIVGLGPGSGVRDEWLGDEVSSSSGWKWTVVNLFKEFAVVTFVHIKVDQLRRKRILEGQGSVGGLQRSGV